MNSKVKKSVQNFNENEVKKSRIFALSAVFALILSGCGAKNFRKRQYRGYNSNN